jgi:hypothetical protein
MCAGVDEMEYPRKSRSGRKQLPDEVRQSEVIRERVTKGMFDSYARLGGKLFLKEVLRLSMVDYREGRRIKATFIPQAWVNDNAIEVDAEGDTVFDVTYLILAMGKDKALLIEDGRDSSDDLLRAETVPTWIREWQGPFRVEVKDEIEAYFA